MHTVFCFKMFVVIEVAGQSHGLQTVESKFVLVKAQNETDAYAKLEKFNQKYAKPYPNDNGEAVRWRVEKSVGCNQTYLTNFACQNQVDEEVVEVYSELAKRKLNADRIWLGE